MAFLIGEMVAFLSWGLGMAHVLYESDIVIYRCQDHENSTSFPGVHQGRRPTCSHEMQASAMGTVGTAFEYPRSRHERVITSVLSLGLMSWV